MGRSAPGPSLLIVLCLRLLCQDSNAIVIVHRFADPKPSHLEIDSLCVNISREVISNEVNHSVDAVQSDVNTIQEKYDQMSRTLSEYGSETNAMVEQLLQEVSEKDDVIDQVTEQVSLLEDKLKHFRQGAIKMFGEIIRSNSKQSGRGVPKWYRKIKEKKLLMKLKNLEKYLSEMEREKVSGGGKSEKSFCLKFRSEGVKGVPKWVQDIKMDRYHRECEDRGKAKEPGRNDHVYFKSNQQGYRDEQPDKPPEQGEIDKEDIQTAQSNTSRKSQKRKIDEVFLKLMMRSQRMSWTDLNLLKENMALFMEHVGETAKLCSRVLLYPQKKNFEECKERIGMNFAMSLAVAMTSTTILVTSVFVSALAVFKLKEFIVATTKQSRSFSPISWLKSSRLSKTHRHIQALMHHVTNPDLCVIMSDQAAKEHCQKLVDRLLATSAVQISTLYHTLATLTDFQLLPTAKAYLVMVDISAVQDRFLFEDETGQNNVLFKINEELFAKSAQTFLVCTQDPKSKQLPVGTLYNRSLVAKNDNYMLRTYCRAGRCVTCNQDFTASQWGHLTSWLQEALK